MVPFLKAYIVEGSAVYRDSLADALEELAPVRVVGTAEDEESAVAWLKGADQRCDLFIVDISLKRGSGLAVLQTASALRPEVHSVVLTNYAAPAVRRRCEQVGARRVFDKSDDFDALIEYCSQLARGAAGSPEISAIG
jgi:DNA-binding NarL/FixJ family response regulator